MSYLMPDIYCDLGYMVCTELIGRRVRMDDGSYVDLRVGDWIEVDGMRQQIVAMLGESGLYDGDDDPYELAHVAGAPVIPLLMACQHEDGAIAHHPLAHDGLSVHHVRRLDDDAARGRRRSRLPWRRR